MQQLAAGNAISNLVGAALSGDAASTVSAASGKKYTAGLILGLRPANERWHYFITTSLIGWAHA